VNNHTNQRLEKHAEDLGWHLLLRRGGVVLFVCGLIWVSAYLIFRSDGKPVLDIFISLGWFILSFLAIVILLMLLNFSDMKKTKDNLTEMIGVHEQQTQLLDLLKPMMAKAFELSPSDIKPALVELLIDSVIFEIGTDSEYTVSRSFLQRQTKQVKDLVWHRCQEMLMFEQQNLESKLQQAKQAKQVMSINEILFLTDRMDGMRQVLYIIPRQLPNEPGPLPCHVSDAHS